jgi:2-dehydro-3-deoxyphosphooctonate aldolase (KDO 8-P synthase)
MQTVAVGTIKIGSGQPLVLIAGPCVIESEHHCLSIARHLKTIAQDAKIPLIFKSSFDKANRMSVDSYRGPGLEAGLDVLFKIKNKLNLPVLSDVHSIEQIEPAASVLDIIQIPALLCRQTDILVAASRTGKVINIKKGQFMAPWDMATIVKKAESVGNRRIILTERGVTFGYNNLVSDFRSLKVMQDIGYPVIYDATHSVQLPGGKGTCSGGQRQFVAALSRAAVAFGCDGLFLEVHPRPDRAPCDGANMIDLKALTRLVQQVKSIEKGLS